MADLWDNLRPPSFCEALKSGSDCGQRLLSHASKDGRGQEGGKLRDMAEREGFEPSIPVRVRTLSRRVP